MHSDRRLFAISFLACLYAGALAVPVPPPDGRGNLEARLAGIVKDAAPLLALADGAGAPDVSRLLARHGHGHIPCLAAEVVPASRAWQEPDLPGDTVAFLQYTSGSTREPQGRDGHPRQPPRQPAGDQPAPRTCPAPGSAAGCPSTTTWA